MRLVLAAAVIAAAFYSASTLANPYIAVDNATTAKNLTSATATQQILGGGDL